MGSHAWKMAHFNPYDLTNAMISGESADPEGDGFKNLGEYAHGLAPASTNEGLINISRPFPDFIDINFPWVDGRTDVSYSVYASPDIEGLFTNIPHTLVSAISDGKVSDTTVRVALPPNTPRMYLQLAVEQGP